MVNNIESIIKEYNLKEIDVIAINNLMHKSHNYLKFPEGEKWEKVYLESFKKNMVLYLNSKEYNLKKK